MTISGHVCSRCVCGWDGWVGGWVGAGGTGPIASPPQLATVC